MNIDVQPRINVTNVCMCCVFVCVCMCVCVVRPVRTYEREYLDSKDENFVWTEMNM